MAALVATCLFIKGIDKGCADILLAEGEARLSYVTVSGREFEGIIRKIIVAHDTATTSKLGQLKV